MNRACILLINAIINFFNKNIDTIYKKLCMYKEKIKIICWGETRREIVFFDLLLQNNAHMIFFLNSCNNNRDIFK